MDIHTCDGVKHYKSGVRSAGTDMCADYWRVHNQLAGREICCDGGSREEKPQPVNKPAEKEKCEPDTSWLGDSSDCKDVQSPQLVINRGIATLWMCGYAVFSYRHSDLNDGNFATFYRSVMRYQLASSGSSKVCCDKFRQAVRTGKPCDPRVDVDCDGTPNKSDHDEFKMPDFDGFVRADNASIDPFPESFDTGNPDFLPDRTARNSKDVGDCPCKWELVKGELNCSPDGKQKHHYKATWRCPKTGAEVVTIRYASPTVPCKKG
jgi:hypothetical protein